MNTIDLTPLAAHPSLEQYKKQAKDFVKLAKSGDSEVARRVKKYHPRPDSAIALADTQLVIAREHGFESWPKFAKHIEGLNREKSPVSNFETAAEAMIAGDTGTLASLLREYPELIRAHSTRVHRATLLHYVGANGFENYRQKSPRNADEIAKMLLDAGAEVDALADIYGKSTTLGLVASSIHPKQAGVQIALMKTLLEYGAANDGSAVVSALRNGRPEAAEFLAQRSARLDLEGAAGVGRLDLVERFFNEASPAKEQMELGFLWACEYGRTSVIDFLLQKGVDIRADGKTGMTGLHWAVVGGKLDAIKLLLQRGAPLEAVNRYGGTVLGQALWCAANGDRGVDYMPVIELLRAHGAAS